MKKTRGLKLETHTTEICEALLFIVKSHCDTDIRDVYLSLTEYCEDASLLVWMGAYTQNNDLLPKSPGSSSWSSSTERTIDQLGWKKSLEAIKTNLMLRPRTTG